MATKKRGGTKRPAQTRKKSVPVKPQKRGPARDSVRKDSGTNSGGPRKK